jgi:PRC-barrel domain protein
MDHPRPGLRYVNVDDLDSGKKTFADFTVEDPAAEKLGKLEGFVIDVDAARPYYVVVNAGGWFHTKHFLLPIGHVALDSESRNLITDVAKERVKRFPGFDLDLFPKMTQQDLDQMAAEISAVCCPDFVIEPAELVSNFEVWAHYETPTWWDASFYNPRRAPQEKPHEFHRA